MTQSIPFSAVLRATGHRLWPRHRFGLLIAAATIIMVWAMLGLTPANDNTEATYLFLLCNLMLAYSIGLGLGGADIAEGTEEFELSLPLTRADVYWSKYLVGFLLASVLIALNLVTVLSGWPAFLAGLFIESAEPWHAVSLPLVALGSVGGFLVFAATYAGASVSHMRTQMTVVGAAAMGLGAYALEQIVFGELFGAIAVPVVVLATVVFTFTGRNAFQRKDASMSVVDNSAQKSTAAKLTLVGGLLALTLLGLVVFLATPGKMAVVILIVAFAILAVVVSVVNSQTT